MGEDGTEDGGRKTEVVSQRDGESAGRQCEPADSPVLRPPSSVFRGQRVRLRAIEPADWAASFAWNQDDEQARSLYNIPFPQSAEAVRQWAQQESTRQPEDDAFRFVIENERGEVVGNLATHDCDRRVGAFSYGVSIRQDQRRAGYAAEAIELVLRYYFQELRYQKVTVRVYSFNDASSRLHEKLGFQLEGRLRRTVFTSGEYFDELIYGLTVEEFVSRP
jgi:RimJ/RimL family protein N-acetyltransferase